MDDGRDTRLRQLLKRLGRAVHASVSDADEVRRCLAELRTEGWDAVMFLEASLVCRDQPDGDDASQIRLHVDTTQRPVEYRLDRDDARWLASIGISPTRHRSHPQRALPPLDRPLLPPPSEG